MRPRPWFFVPFAVAGCFAPLGESESWGAAGAPGDELGTGGRRARPEPSGGTLPGTGGDVGADGGAPSYGGATDSGGSPGSTGGLEATGGVPSGTGGLEASGGATSTGGGSGGAEAEPELACNPKSSRQCLNYLGQCVGWQSCLPDGSGWETTGVPGTPAHRAVCRSDGATCPNVGPNGCPVHNDVRCSDGLCAEQHGGTCP